MIVVLVLMTSCQVSPNPNSGPVAAQITINDKEVAIPDGMSAADLGKAATPMLQEAGYPKAGDAEIVKMSNPFDIFRPQPAAVIGLLFVLVLFVTMVYGPIAAALVELFPTRIRYTSMSLPYHIGNGWFGGFLPAISFAMVAAQGDIYYGLWYPIVVASISFVIGMIFIRETKDHKIDVW